MIKCHFLSHKTEENICHSWYKWPRSVQRLDPPRMFVFCYALQLPLLDACTPEIPPESYRLAQRLIKQLDIIETQQFGWVAFCSWRHLRSIWRVSCSSFPCCNGKGVHSSLHCMATAVIFFHCFLLLAFSPLLPLPFLHISSYCPPISSELWPSSFLCLISFRQSPTFILTICPSHPSSWAALEHGCFISHLLFRC